MLPSTLSLLLSARFIYLTKKLCPTTGLTQAGIAAALAGRLWLALDQTQVGISFRSDQLLAEADLKGPSC